MVCHKIPHKTFNNSSVPSLISFSARSAPGLSLRLSDIEEALDDSGVKDSSSNALPEGDILSSLSSAGSSCARPIRVPDPSSDLKPNSNSLSHHNKPILQCLIRGQLKKD